MADGRSRKRTKYPDLAGVGNWRNCRQNLVTEKLSLSHEQYIFPQLANRQEGVAFIYETRNLTNTNKKCGAAINSTNDCGLSRIISLSTPAW